MTTPWTTTMLLTGALVAATGCGGAPERTKAEPMPPEEAPVRACELLTEREWTGVLGAAQAAPSEETLRVSSAMPNRFKSSCLFSGADGAAIVFIERPYITRAGSSEDLAEKLRGYQNDPATQRDSRLYPELKGKTITPYEGLGVPAVTLTSADDGEPAALLAVRQTGITTGVRVEAPSMESARTLAERALGRLP